MTVLINFKICDNAKECGGISECPVEAIFWDEEKNTLATNNDNCTSCGLCEPACPVGAIRIAYTTDDVIRIKNEIENDKRSIEQLFVDRYGAVPIDETILLDETEFANFVLNNKSIIMIELFDDNSIQCLLKSIPVSDILQYLPHCAGYRKTQISNDLRESLNISDLPALLVYSKQQLLGSIPGYIDIENAKELRKQIKSIINEN